jgi:magnesium transporter
MKKRTKRIVKNLSPGTIIYTGEHTSTELTIKILQRTHDETKEIKLENENELMNIINSGELTWIDIIGLADTDFLSRIGKITGIHKLSLEDIADVKQRPKIDFQNGNILTVMKHLNLDEEFISLEIEQVSIILGYKYIITFSERKSNLYDSVKTRFLSRYGQLATANSGYLFYALIDAIIDNYFNIIESAGIIAESIEDELSSNPKQPTLMKIQALRRTLITILRIFIPAREVVHDLLKNKNDERFVEIEPYLKDLYDHALHISEGVDSLREFVTSMMDFYLSTINNKLNEVMKVLTVVGAIFIPITFLAGVYGMNFDYFPEIHFKYGYLLFWIIVVCSVIFSLWIFRKNKWL